VAVAAETTGSDSVNVLVGLLDDVPQDVSAVLPAPDGLGERLGRLTLARVLNFGTMLDREERTRAALELSCASPFLYEHDTEPVLLGGRPQPVFRDGASDAAYHVAGPAGRAIVPRRDSVPEAHGGAVPMLFVPAAPAAQE
jgi:hypothetical protein